MQLLPPLPTDTFWKFLTVAGIALFAASYAYPEAMIYAAHKRQNEIDTQIDVLQVEMDRAKTIADLRQDAVVQEVKWLDQRTDILKRRLEEADQSAALEIMSNLQAIQRRNVEIGTEALNTNYAIQKRLTEIKGASRRQKIEVRRLQRFRRLSDWGMGVSALLIGVGIVGWMAREFGHFRPERSGRIEGLDGSESQR